jgi:protease-4
MKEFFKFMFASMLGTFLIGIVLIVLFAVAMAAAIAGGLAGAGGFSGGKTASIDANSVLHLRLDEEIQDRGSDDDLQLDFGPFRSMNKLGLNDILEDLDRAKTDDRIKGVFLDLTMVQGGMATLSEIRNKLVEFRKDSGKPVVAYSEFYTQGTYYLASAADEVYTVPEGDLDFRGLQTELMFFKGLFEKLGIDVQFIKGNNNIYKSFGEAFTEKEMTPANHEQMQRLLSSLWGHYLERISETRKIDVQRLNTIADSLMIRYAPDAVTFGLIDGVKYRDEVLAIVKQKMGLDADKDINFADLGKYDRAKPSVKKEGAEGKKGKIAVVFAQGSIASGENEDDVIGSETVSAALREAREDSTVKAIVFRVNSPGGSGLASDVIWREVQLCKEQGKPLVVSMGDLAASGGYYISCAAQRIYAEPTTITGSIGVFGIIPNFQGFFNDKLGITFDGDKTNRYADMFNVSRPMREDERRIIQDYVDHFYSTFKQRVADGRNMPPEKVDELGRGRVWTGIDAKENGLVDELGGLEMAIKGAAEIAGLSEYRTVDYPEEKGLWEKLLEDLNTEAKAWLAEEAFGADVELMEQFSRMREVRRMTGIQARLSYEIAVR